MTAGGDNDTEDTEDPEREFFDAVRANDRHRVHRLLADMWVYQAFIMNGPEHARQDTLFWYHGEQRFLRTYTSKRAAAKLLASHAADEAPNYVTSDRFTHLLSRDWLTGIVINPDSESESRVPRVNFDLITAPRWYLLSVGDGGLSLLPRLSPKIAQVTWYPAPDDPERPVYALVATIDMPNDRYEHIVMSRLSENLADDVARDLGPPPPELRRAPRFEAAQFIGVGITTTIDAEPGVDPGWLQSRVLRALYRLLNPITGGPDGTGWPFARHVTRDEIRQALATADGVARVAAIRMRSLDPLVGYRNDDVTEILLNHNEVLYSLDHEVAVTPSDADPPEPPAVTPPAPRRRRRRARTSLAIGTAVVPVVLGTILQIVDKASAPVWVVIALIALTGAATLAATVRSARADTDAPVTTGMRAPGKLEIADIKLEHVAFGLKRVDFRLSNTGGSTVSIHAVEFESVAVEVVALVFGVQEVSATYDVDITPLQSEGTSVTCDVAQQIAPGDVDRFVVQLKSTIPHQLSRFAIRPILMTSVGPVSGSLIELIPQP